ncbi:MAG TPA: twitch domain-containing radical SAM protein [Actinospica sp.]|nr:twitch domain-containing radical SAM protein [Actinospica sp.]
MTTTEDRPGRTFVELTDNGTFCALPWLHLSTSVDGVWARCCVDATAYHDEYYGQPNEPAFLLEEDSVGCVANSRYARDNPQESRGFQEAFNSPAMKRTRLAMLDGEKVPACKYCYLREASGGESYRQQVNRNPPAQADMDALLAVTAPDGFLPGFPSYLDLRFGNSCNLSCIMCGFPTSSRWGVEKRVHWMPANIDPYRDDDALWEELGRNADKLRRIYFAGGEPFMQPLHFKALDLFVSSGAASHIELFYNSNLTIAPAGIFDKLRLFKSVVVGASCDGTGATFEAIRRGAKWAEFVNNVDLFRQHVKVTLQVAPQRDNIHEIGSILEFAQSREIEVDLRNFVHFPEELSARNLPLEARRTHIVELRQLADECNRTGRPNEADHLGLLVEFLRAGDAETQ